MYAMYQANQRERALLEWANAGLFNVLGYGVGLLHLEHLAPVSLVNAVPNILYLLAHIAILRGVLSFLNIPKHNTITGVAILIFFACQLFPSIASNLEYRIYIYTFAVLLVKSVSISILYKTMSKEREWFYIPLLVTELFFLLQMLARSFLLFFQHASIDIGDANTAIQTVGWLSDVLFLTAATVSCVLLILRKQVVEIEHLSYRDQLTGCLNRHALTEKINTLFSSSNRSSNSLGVVLLDIDFFKRINDDYGHDVGDLALSHVSSILNDLLTDKDSLYRIGGEEFLILSLDMTGKSVNELAEKLRGRIEISHLQLPEKALKVTSSFGVTLCTLAENWPNVLKRADMALYKAKENGRNKCVFSIDKKS
ncbi:diguanylate cyclase [Pseudoalteromonas luteoviolacea B = ATCC 29581]|nr:diguanylate cyclase [Pseudoalteromonas luteoviolacea B = ATCC 29581]